MTDIKNIAAKHVLWLLGDAGGARANLSGADLSGADLSGAKSVVELVVNDPRGYRAIAVAHASKWMVASGCRWLSAADALAHWGSSDYPDRARGDAYVAAIKALPAISTEDTTANAH